MSNTDVRPSAMNKYMERHSQRFATMSKTARRVKIEQNHTWRLRLLPVQIGPDKEPFIDIAQHWWNKSPVTCPKHTGEAWGGDPDFPCPICEISERLMNSSSEEINNIGYRVRCSLRVRSWCLVFDMEDQRGNIEEMPMSEILNPYEFDMFKTTWERFSKFQKWAMSGRRAGSEPSEWGILDLETGCDLLATAGAKGVTLDRCDPSPIFPVDDPNFDSYIEKIWSHIRKPQIIIPTEKQLLEVAVKVEEYAERGGRSRRGREDEDDFRGRGRGSRGRFNEDDDDGGTRGRGRSRTGEDEDDAAPRSRRSFARGENEEPTGGPAPIRRRVAEPEPEAAPEAADAPAPPPRRTAPATRAAAPEQPEAQQETVAPPTRRTSAATTASPPARRTAPPPEAEDKGVTSEDMSQDQNPEPAPPPPARRGTRPAAPPLARRSPPPDQADAGEPAETTAPPPPRRTTAAPAAGGVDEDEDNVPEEQRDPAPPVRERVADEAPPSVSAAGPAPKRSSDPTGRVGDSSGIKARLDRLTTKGR